MSTTRQAAKLPTFENPQFFDSHGRRGWTCNLCSSSKDANANIKFMTTKAAVAHEQSSELHIRNVVCEEAGRWEWSDTPLESSEWTNPLPISAQELKGLDVGFQFDDVRDSHIIPFWIRGVEAAELGEVPRMEDFLESLPKDSWAQWSSDSWEPFAYPAGQWGSAAVEDEGRGWGASGDGWTPAPNDSWAGTSRNHGWGSGIDAHRWGVGDGASGWGQVRQQHSNTSSEGHHAPARRKVASPNPDLEGYRLEADNGFLDDITRQKDVTSARKQRMRAFAKLSTQDKIVQIHDLIRYLHTTQT
ncbi:hypothetical protein HGRIS_008084 [Hohenbuehelia grisea]|uniref:Uncharacterized protein n=1 Tax=Hohenbuehelia grisea TaxID=104357 RepID=A0ABR3J7M6_9AGAR